MIYGSGIFTELGKAPHTVMPVLQGDELVCCGLYCCYNAVTFKNIKCLGYADNEILCLTPSCCVPDNITSTHEGGLAYLSQGRTGSAHIGEEAPATRQVLETRFVLHAVQNLQVSSASSASTAAARPLMCLCQCNLF